MKTRTAKKIPRRHVTRLCRACSNGSCCRDGVDVDLKHAMEITLLNLDIPRPWFQKLRRDKDFPSGWSVETVIRNRKCIFQREDRLCRIYEQRPVHCADFPYEKGRLHRYYTYLCYSARKRKNKPKG